MIKQRRKQLELEQELHRKIFGKYHRWQSEESQQPENIHRQIQSPIISSFGLYSLLNASESQTIISPPPWDTVGKFVDVHHLLVWISPREENCQGSWEVLWSEGRFFSSGEKQQSFLEAQKGETRNPQQLWHDNPKNVTKMYWSHRNSRSGDWWSGVPEFTQNPHIGIQCLRWVL